MKKLPPIWLALMLAAPGALAPTARAAPPLPDELVNAPLEAQNEYLDDLGLKALAEKKALAQERYDRRRQAKLDLGAGLKTEANAYQKQVLAERTQAKSKLTKSGDGMNLLFHVLFVLMLLGATGGFIYYWRPETFQVFSAKKK